MCGSASGLIAGAAAGVLGAACVPGSTGGGAPGSGTTLKSGVKLTAVGWGGPISVQTRQLMTEEFARKHPGLTAEYAERDTATYWDKLQGDLAAGTPPDIFFMNPYFFKAYALQKAYLNLTPLIRRDKVDLNDVYPVARQLYEHRGEQFGLPLHFNGINLLFNKNLFEANGVKLPSQDLKAKVWTFDEHLDACRRLSRTEGGEVTQWGTSINTAFQWYLSFVYANGGDLFNKDQTACVLTEAAATDALQHLQDLAHRHRVAAMGADLSKQGLGLQAAFTNGKTAMYWASGAPEWGAIRRAQFAWDAGILPIGKGKPATGMGGPGYAAARQSPNPDEAWVLIDHLTNKEAQIAEVKAGTITPSRRSVANSPDFLSLRPPENVKVVSDTLEVIKLPPQLPNWRDIQVRLDEQMAPFWRAEKTATAAALAVKQQLDPLLQEAKRMEDAAK
jgi:multiple sugar transport system substrate-binding protein